MYIYIYIFIYMSPYDVFGPAWSHKKKAQKFKFKNIIIPHTGKSEML